MAPLISSSRDVIQVMLLAIVFLCGLTAASGGCPRGCKCDADSGTVSCLHIGSFPTELPAATKNITILQSVFNEIPTGAFDNLQQLESITFQEMTVGTIQRRAFYRIGRGIHSKELKFVMVTIENIERGAFEELEDFKSILISNANLSHVSSSGFNKLNNIASFVITTATIHTLRSNSFTSFSNVTDITIMDSTIDLIEQEAFSHFTHVKRFSLFRLNVGSLGSRFVTLDGTEIVNILQNTFELWKDCAFCGINAANVEISRNIVNGTEGNVFRGIRVVTALGIISNTLPFIVARFLPFDLPDQALINFSRNKLTSIICDGLGTDYPSNIIYSIGENEVTCDCRLNWMWKIWSNTHATHTLTPGFVCAGPEKQSLSDYFRKVSTSEITPPCNGIEPVNDCGGPTTDSGSQTTINATAAVAMIKARWMSALVVVILTLMAS